MKDFFGSLHILIALFISTTGGDDVVVYGEVGGTVTLLKTEKKNPLYVYWKFGKDAVIQKNPYGVVKQEGKQWNGRVSLSQSNNNYSLIISKLQTEDFFIKDNEYFSCELKDGNKLLSITNFYLYKVSVQGPRLPLLAGETLSLFCNRQNPQKTGEVRWRSPQGRNLGQDHRVQGSTSPNLTVKIVTGEDHGKWLCIVISGDQEAHASTWVTVVDLTPAPKQPLYTYNNATSPPLIPCSIQSNVSFEELRDKDLQAAHWNFTPSKASGLPLRDQASKRLLTLGPSSEWKVVNKTMWKVPFLQNKNLSLRLKSVTERDRGDYTCSLNFKNGTVLKRVIQLEVLEVLSSHGPDPDLLVGQEVNLMCSLGHSLSSDLKVKWHTPRFDSVDSKSFSLSSANLTIQKVGMNHRGLWKCELWKNEEKLTSAQISLRIARAPMEPWLLVTICAAAVIFILLLILTVILFRRHRQRGMMPRRRKHRFCRCKEPKPKGFYRT